MTLIKHGDALLDILHKLGVEGIRDGGDEVGARCPVHLKRTGKEDGHPSWSISKDSGLWICYSCGAKGNLLQLVEEVTGSANAEQEVHQFIIKSGLERLQASIGDDVEVEKYTPNADVDLFRTFTQVPEQLLEHKGIDPEVAKHHGIRWDTENRRWIIPIMSPTGDLWGWQEKAKGYFRNVPTGVKKSETLFGLDRFRAKTAVLLESPLDVVRLASLRLGTNTLGLASFGAHISNEQVRLAVHYSDRLVIALDNDEAGINAANRLFGHCPRPRHGLYFLKYEHTKAKDLGDMTNSDIEEAISGATYLPWWLT